MLFVHSVTGCLKELLYSEIIFLPNLHLLNFFFNKMLDLLLGFSQLIKQPSCHIVEGIVLLPPGLESHVLPATPCLGSILHEPNHVRSSQNCKMQSGRVRRFRLPADEPKHDSPNGRPETAGEVLNDERCWAGAAAGSLHTFWSGA